MIATRPTWIVPAVTVLALASGSWSARTTGHVASERLYVTHVVAISEHDIERAQFWIHLDGSELTWTVWELPRRTVALTRAEVDELRALVGLDCTPTPGGIGVFSWSAYPLANPRCDAAKIPETSQAGRRLDRTIQHAIDRYVDTRWAALAPRVVSAGGTSSLEQLDVHVCGTVLEAARARMPRDDAAEREDIVDFVDSTIATDDNVRAACARHD